MSEQIWVHIVGAPYYINQKCHSGWHGWFVYEQQYDIQIYLICYGIMLMMLCKDSLT